MTDKIDISEIKLASCSQYDVIGRVFFARGRVFRAISFSAANDVKEFMSSVLFKELIDRHWIPYTWITDDITIPGYAFCLEHERIFASEAKEWSFEMMKEAALFTIKINALCKQYGYIIKDALFDNICFIYGKPCMVDFGSFRRIEIAGQPLYKFYFVWNIYVYLSMYSQGADLIARSLLNGWLIEKPFVVPDNTPERLSCMEPFIRDVIWGYDYHIRVRYPHIRLYKHLLPLLWLVDALRWVVNAIVRLSLKKEHTWCFIKKNVIYKDIKEDDILRLQAAYYNSKMCYSLEDSSIINDFYLYIQKNKFNFVGNDATVVLFGNFVLDDVRRCFPNNDCTIVSNDSVYVDSIFKDILKYQYRINPICTNIFAPNLSKSSRDRMKGELVIVNSMLSEWEYPTTSSRYFQPPRAFISIVERLADYAVNWLVIPAQNANNELVLNMYFDRICEIGGGGILYKNKSKQ